MKNFDRFLKGEIIYDARSLEDYNTIIETTIEQIGEYLTNKTSWKNTNTASKYADGDTLLEVSGSYLLCNKNLSREGVHVFVASQSLKRKITTKSIVKLRNGDIRCVATTHQQLALINQENHISLDFYSDDLTHSQTNRFDVVAMIHYKSQANAIYNVMQDDFEPSWSWKRVEITNYDAICKDKGKLIDIMSSLTSIICNKCEGCADCDVRNCCNKSEIRKFLDSPSVDFDEYLKDKTLENKAPKVYTGEAVSDTVNVTNNVHKQYYDPDW